MISRLRYNNRSEVMGRTTRVFGARVLRSGRRVWTGPALEPVPEGKHPHHHHHHLVRARPVGGSEELIEILENTRNEGNDDYYDDVAVEVTDSDHHHCHDYKQSNKNVWQNGNGNDNEMDMEKTMEMEVDEKDGHEGGLSGLETQPESADNEGKEDKKEVVAGNRRWGIVYKRKRKREKGQRDIVDNADNNDNKDSVRGSDGSYVVDVGRKFGRQFVRRKRMRETLSDVFVPDNCDVKVHLDSLDSRRTHRMLAIVVEACASSGSGRSSYWIISCFLNSVLRYLRRAELGLRHLYAFVCSSPIVHVYSACGIHFLQDFCTVASGGVCIIWGARSSIPIFSVDFSALPFCFMYLHSSLLIRSAALLHVCVTNSMSIFEEGNVITGNNPASLPPERDQAGSEVVASRNDHTYTMGALHHTFGVPKLAGKNLQLKNGRGIQKRRSSLRSKRGRPPSIFRMQKVNGALASELFRSRHNRIQLSPLASTRQLRSSTQRNHPTNIRELKSSLVEFTQDIGSASCSANILVIESDKCYRVEGAIVSLELSESKQWSLTVKKDGMKRYSIKAQKVMRPCNTNRFTHAMLWIGDNSWKLEFPTRQDWLIFKELYKKCFDRNLHTPLPSVIPVPRACEVEGYADGESVPFVRPDSYITVRDDELTRALVKSTANYDMDSDDEEWLNKFNNGTCAENDFHEHLSAERFELMIDAFEKAVHCNPDDFSNKEAAFSIFPDLERRVVEAVYSYWSKKRKQKRSALIRIFQFYQPRRTQLFPKSIFRKKRSFKRQGSQAGRGKQRTLLQAMAAEQDAVEQQNAFKVQEAKASASRSGGLAIEKRQRAQLLMENADLATYKAAMALRIAEAAQIAESTDAAASFFLV